MDIPLGLGMALAQDESAMVRFSAMSADEKSAVIRRARSVSSKEEMQRLVTGLSSASSSGGFSD